MGKMFNALQKLEREKTGREAQKSPDTDIPEYAVLDDKLVSFFAPSSLVTEQFRRLRTHIIKPNAPSTYRTIMVTSAMPGEGKSLISINLAVIIALELHSHALWLTAICATLQSQDFRPARRGLSGSLL